MTPERHLWVCLFRWRTPAEAIGEPAAAETMAAFGAEVEGLLAEDRFLWTGPFKGSQRGMLILESADFVEAQRLVNGLTPVRAGLWDVDDLVEWEVRLGDGEADEE